MVWNDGDMAYKLPAIYQINKWLVWTQIGTAQAKSGSINQKLFIIDYQYHVARYRLNHCGNMNERYFWETNT